MAEALAAFVTSTQRNERKLFVTIRAFPLVRVTSAGHLLQQAPVASAQSDDQFPFGYMIISCIPALVFVRLAL